MSHLADPNEQLARLTARALATEAAYIVAMVIMTFYVAMAVTGRM
jgi:hypothetical protein